MSSKLDNAIARRESLQKELKAAKELRAELAKQITLTNEKLEYLKSAHQKLHGSLWGDKGDINRIEEAIEASADEIDFFSRPVPVWQDEKERDEYAILKVTKARVYLLRAWKDPYANCHRMAQEYYSKETGKSPGWASDVLDVPATIKVFEEYQEQQKQQKEKK